MVRFEIGQIRSGLILGWNGVSGSGRSLFHDHKRQREDSQYADPADAQKDQPDVGRLLSGLRRGNVGAGGVASAGDTLDAVGSKAATS